MSTSETENSHSSGKNSSILKRFCGFIGLAFLLVTGGIIFNCTFLHRENEKIIDQYGQMAQMHSDKLIRMHERDFGNVSTILQKDEKQLPEPTITDKKLQQSIACDTAVLRYETALMIDRTENLIRTHLNAVEANYNHILIWVGVLTLLFLVFSFFGLFKIEETIKRAKDTLEEAEKTAREILKDVQDEAGQTIDSLKKNSNAAIENLKKESEKALKELNLKFESAVEIFKLQQQLSDAKQFYNDKEYDKAIDAFNELIKAITKSSNKSDEIKYLLANAYNGRGIVYDEIKNNEEAIKDYNKAIEINPKYTQAYNNRGNTYGNLKKYDEAIKDYDKAIEIDPKYAQAYCNRGTAYNGLRKYEEAIKDYDKAIEIGPKYALTYCNRGAAYNDLGKYEEAIKDYNKAIEIDPKYAFAYFNKALLLFAVAMGNKFLEIGRESVEQCYQEALQDVDKGLELTPDDEKAIKLKKNIETELKKLSKNSAPNSKNTKSKPKK